jgi:hypothetical protein
VKRYMRNIEHPADVALWIVLLLGLLACTCMIVATIANQVATLAMLSDGLHLSPMAKKVPTFRIIAFEALPFILMITAILFTEQHLKRGKIPRGAYIFLLGTTVLAFGWAFIWFQHPMHEIAMYFGSHGRWGCGAVNADGSYFYIIRDATAPWMIFSPMIVVFITHWMWSRKHERTEQSVPGYPPQGVGSPGP